MATTQQTQAPAVNPADVSQMAELLRGMTANDTAIVMSSTRAINAALRNAEAVVVLLEVLRGAPDPTLRQLAAVVLRKRAAGHWSRIPPASQNHVKAALLERVAYDDSHLVRTSVAEVVGVLAKMALPAGQWPELMPFLNQCVQSPDHSHREAALKLFGVLTDTILNDERNRAHKRFFLQVIAHAIQDASNPPAVRIAAVVAVGSLIKWLETEQEVAEFRDSLLPHLLEVVRGCVQSGLEQPVILAFEVFDELMESDTKASLACIPALAQFALEVTSNANLDLPIRQIAFSFIEWVARFKPKFLVKNHMLKPVLTALLTMMTEPEEDADNEEEDTAHKFGAEMLDLFTEVLPTRKFYAEAIVIISQQLQSQDPNVLKAGLAALAVIAENCCESLKTHLRDIMPFVLRAFASPSKQIRTVALVALSEFSTYLQPDIIDFHADVMPAMMHVMSDADLSVQRKGCMVFQAFAVALGDRVVPYAPQMVQHLGNTVLHGSAEVRDVAILGIAALADSCGPAFAPFFPAVAPMLVTLANAKGADALLVRGRAIECLGCLAKVVGRETFGPAMMQLMEGAIESLSVESPYSYDVAEMVFGFFADAVELFGQEFATFLPAVMPRLSAMIESTAGLCADKDEHAGDDAVTESTELEDDDEDDEDDDDQLEIGVDLAFLDAKCAAINCVGELAKLTGAAFLPYVEQIAKQLIMLKDYAYHNIRAAVMFALPCLLDPFSASLPPPPNALPEPFAQLLTGIMAACIEAINTDDMRDVVINSMDGISHVCQVVGERGIQPFFTQISEVLLKAMRRETNCQMDEAEADEDEEDKDDEEPEEDREIELFETVGEVVIELTKVYKERLLPWFTQALPLFTRLLRPENAHYYRSLSIATMAEFVRVSGVNPAPMVSTLFSFVLAGMSDPNETVRRNSAFCCGVVLGQAGQAAAQYYNEGLQRLGALLSVPAGDAPAVRDNAIGAVARMAVACPALVPLEQVLPVWLAALPLQDDAEEYAPVCAFLAWMQSNASDLLVRNLLAVLTAVARAAAGGPGVAVAKPDTAAFLTQFVRGLSGNAQSFSDAASKLPAELQAVVARLASP